MYCFDPAWLIEAKKNIGVARTHTTPGNPTILQYWKDIKRGGIKDEKVAWCSAFAGAMMERCGIVSTRFESAKSWLEWGEKLPQPVYGCVVVFTRSGGGHVGFVVGQRANGDLLVLGGNQSDTVCVRAFPRARVEGYRWPSGMDKPSDTLPIGEAQTSVREN